MTARVAAVVLAAGRGCRFDPDHRTPKVVALLRDVPLVRAVAATALASRATSVVVVAGHAHAEVEAALSGLEVRIVANAAFATGMASSIQAGLAALPADVDGMLVMLADMPFVATGTLDALIDRLRERPDTIDAAIPVCDGQRGNPVLIGRRLFARVAALKGDEGARQLLRDPAIAVELVDVDDPGVTIDIDTLAELTAFDRAGSSGPRR